MILGVADPAPGAARLGRHPDRQHLAGGADRRRASPSSARSSASSPARRRSSSAGCPRRHRLLRPAASPSSRCARCVPAPRRAAEGAARSGTAGAGSSSAARGRARSAPSALLLLLAIPLFSIRLGFGDYGNYPEDQTVRRAYDLLAEGFGPGHQRAALRHRRGSSGRRTKPRSRQFAADRRRPPRTSAVARARPRSTTQLGARHRLPGERAAGRGDDDARERAPRRRHPADRRRRQGRRPHRGVHRLRQRTSAVACRC